MSEPNPTTPVRLRISVSASFVLMLLLLIQFLGDLREFGSVLRLAILPLSICGLFCGLTVIFKLRGFHALVAGLSALVSFYALFMYGGLLAWMIGRG